MESGNSGAAAYSFDPHGGAARAAPAMEYQDGNRSHVYSSPDYVVIRASSARSCRGRKVYPEHYEQHTRRSHTPRHDDSDVAMRRIIRDEADRTPHPLSCNSSVDLSG